MIVEKENDVATVGRRCELLSVSRSGYYRWRTRKQHDGNLLEGALRILIGELHRHWLGLLGYRRMHSLLAMDGIQASSRQVRRIMKEERLFGHPGGRKSRYQGRFGIPVSEDRVRRNFTSDHPNHCWVSDITQFSTLDGKLYLCHVKDLYDGVIVGWSMEVRADTELVIRALAMAWRERVERTVPIVFHSDRGTQYTSGKLASWLREHKMVASMGAVGSSADNASAESFFGVLKRDLNAAIRHMSRYEARNRINDYIVNLHNPLRRASEMTVSRRKREETDATMNSLNFHGLAEETS